MTAFLLFIIGLLIGSFANVIVYRLHEKEKGIITGRSRCPKCKHVLHTIDLIPIISFVLLKGKCRYCGKPISYRYISGELTMGLAFALIGMFYPLDPAGQIVSQLSVIISLLIIVFILIIITFYDLLYYEIPDIIMIPGIFIGLIISFFDPTLLLRSGAPFFGMESLPLYALIGGLIPFSFFGLQILVSRGKWMGGGDLRLGAFMGIILGIKLVIIALIIAYFFGAIAGLTAIAIKKKKMKSQIPFGPFLSLGTIVALFWGETIIAWYLGLLI